MEGSRELCTEYWISAKVVQEERKSDILAAQDVKEAKRKKKKI